MFEAQLLIAKAQDYEVFSPWFARGGDNARFTLDVVEISGAQLDVEVVTKNSEDAGDGGTPVSGSISATTVGRTTTEWEGLVKELVRYRFTVSGGSAGDWVLFRMLPPVWFDDVEA